MSLSTRIFRSAERIHRIYDELDYANRRMFEIRTGLPAPRRTR